MDKELFDIGDNEIRVLGSTESRKDTPKPKHRWWYWILAVLLLITLAIVYWKISHHPTLIPSTYVEEPVMDSTQNVTFETPIESKAYTLITCETVNDITMQIYTPVGAHVELHVGPLPFNDKNIILAAQAADYRADNGEISGAFVYKGELLSRGHPKYGFCAIIGDKLTMGKSRETVLFERAVEQEGYFFRQFSLVHDGKFGEKKLPKGKALRRALCYYQENIVIVETMERESMHDFTQALIDTGVQEAVGLVGYIKLPLYEDKEGNRIINKTEYKEDIQETYIVWRK